MAAEWEAIARNPQHLVWVASYPGDKHGRDQVLLDQWYTDMGIELDCAETTAPLTAEELV